MNENIKAIVFKNDIKLEDYKDIVNESFYSNDQIKMVPCENYLIKNENMDDEIFIFKSLHNFQYIYVKDKIENFKVFESFEMLNKNGIKYYILHAKKGDIFNDVPDNFNYERFLNIMVDHVICKIFRGERLIIKNKFRW